MTEKKKKPMSKDNDFERFAQQLQNIILEQAREEYSDAVIEHWQNPRNFKETAQPDGYAKVKGTCGDTMEMFIKMKDQRITECSFQTDGCAATIACGSAATEIALKKTFTEALAFVSGETILQKLGGLPEGHIHCAFLAAETLRRALADSHYHQKYSWKKQYRKT
jgi:nitrogen fixation NifU-like protein